MTEVPSSPEEVIKDKVGAIYNECRENDDLYTSPSGIPFTVGGVDWRVVYWPASPDNEERIGLTRDSEELINPVSYSVKLRGYVTKNDKIAKRVWRGVFFDPTGKRKVRDPAEVDLLHSIIVAAHNLKRHQ